MGLDHLVPAPFHMLFITTITQTPYEKSENTCVAKQKKRREEKRRPKREQDYKKSEQSRNRHNVKAHQSIVPKFSSSIVIGIFFRGLLLPPFSSDAGFL